MAFKANPYQQIFFQDSFNGLTSHEQKTLKKSWVKVFADELFRYYSQLIKAKDLFIKNFKSNMTRKFREENR